MRLIISTGAHTSAVLTRTLFSTFTNLNITKLGLQIHEHVNLLRNKTYEDIKFITHFGTNDFFP